VSTSAIEPGAAGSTARNELINAIADLALAARAGTLLRIYQRQWSWTDVRNGIDEVDADRFNATFHEIEGEFDALATVLGSGSGLVAPDWQQVLQFPPGPTMVVLTHNLGTTDLLVDMAAGINPNLPALDQVDLSHSSLTTSARRFGRRLRSSGPTSASGSSTPTVSWTPTGLPLAGWTSPIACRSLGSRPSVVS
jgi:hypothetical protein